ncbi:MAG: hypothetical protein CMJ69_09280 [Planctomycetaceae bacterium]|nr:hypothetical protein [Planctomycetaceae bacterium]|tara:strand:+ start:549 stop:971 length:423 start_codon:yes stop_codon:yes gene_type:complete
MSTTDSSRQPEPPSEWPEASFRELVTMCTSPALMGLGIVPAPGQDEPAVDLPLARHFIDLLALLDDKTGDRLDASDQEALDQSLHELRMAFVQVQQSARAETQTDSGPSETVSSASDEDADPVDAVPPDDDHDAPPNEGD